VEATPLAHFYAGGRTRAQALVLGFGAASPERIRVAVDALAAAIDEVAQGTRGDK
jgi:DNA-binding transcriptional MocR family regulator